MKKRFIYISIIFLSTIKVVGQISTIGEVSFTTSTNVYVKFSSTEKILVGDTLYNGLSDKKALLVISSKSSTSVVGKNLTSTELPIGTKLFHIIEVKKEVTEIIEHKKETINTPPVIITEDQIIAPTDNKQQYKNGYNGRLNVSMNTLAYSAIDKVNNRLRTSFSLNTFHQNKIISATQSYIAYRKNLNDNKVNTSFFDDLKIYNLAAQVSLSSKDAFWVGRKINNYIANIGAIDGIQYDHAFSKSFSSGVFYGSRPDILDYGINLDLRQYGGYVNHISQKESKYIQTSIAAVNQLNNGVTDRRFVYLQHNNSVVKSVNIFGSIEMDLYQNYNNKPMSIFRITSLYTSLRYRISKRISLSTSYDNRKNIVYFESNKIYIDSLIDNETRQGLRFQISISPFKKVNINASRFYRYQERFANTDNTNININFTKLPIIDANLSLNTTTFNSGFIKSEIYGGRLNKYFIKNKLQIELNYRKIKYSYPSNEFSINQNAYGFNLSYQLMRMMMINFNYEATKESSNDYTRYFITVTRRFKG